MNFRRLRRYAPLLPLAALVAGGIALFPADPDAPDQQLAVAAVEPVQPSYLAVPIATVEPLPVRTAEPPPARPSLSVTTTAVAVPPPALEPPEPEPDEEAATEAAWVGTSALNVRAGPSSSTAKLFVLQPGTKVAAAETEGGWVRIIADDGQEGWVFGRYIGSQPPQQRAAAPEQQQTREAAAPPQQETRQQGRTARIAGRVTLRSSPSGLSQRLFVLEPGERVVIAERRGSWARVVADGGISGWVRLN